MKIAILTLGLGSNYGGIIQCYALQTTLIRMGYDVEVLSEPRYKLSYYFMYPLSCIKRLFLKLVQNKNVDILRPFHKIIYENMYKFIDDNINVYVCKKWNRRLAGKYDIIIVGSDQVWRPEYAFNIERYFLDFTESVSIRRIAYAASFGVDNPHYTDEQKKRCSSLLKQFNSVSVREFSGIDICAKYFNVSALLMPDPTFLLTRDDYLNLISTDNTTCNKGDLLVYYLDNTIEKELILKDLIKETGLLPYYGNARSEDEDIPIEQKVYPKVTQWLRGFQQAKFIITDSFHGCVFSIIFNKPFIAIGNLERGLSRFVSLLQNFGLQDRLIYSFDEYKNKKAHLLADINHDIISSICAIQKEKGIRFLKNSLN